MKAAQLRQSILQAAVQGKLVLQNIHDEPASKLLDRIRQEKARLVKECKIKKEKPLPPIDEDEIPYDLPDGWIWCRLGDLTTIFRGASPRPKGDPRYWDENNRTPYHWIKISDISKYTKYDTLYDTDEFLTEEGKELSVYVNADFVITAASGSIGKSALLGIEGYIYDGLIALRVYGDTINKRFLISFISNATSHLVDESTGTSWKNIRTETLKTILFPLPPIAEQQRIVAKVDELMALCDKLEATERELDKLEADFAEYLPKSILQAAVQGQVVPQNVHDEPADKLLERIRAEKARLIKEGKIKKEKPLPPIIEDEIPYDLPDGWVWCHIIDVYYTLSDQTHNVQQRDVLSKGQYPVISQGKELVLGYTNDATKVIQPESPIIIFGDHTRQVKFINFAFATGADGVKILIPLLLDCKYFYYYLLGTEVEERGYARHYSRLKKQLFPLPPLAEQQRIVAKVDELMALCDELKMARDIPLEVVPSNIVPFPTREDEAEEIGIAARGDVRGLSDEAMRDIDELFGDEAND